MLLELVLPSGIKTTATTGVRVPLEWSVVAQVPLGPFNTTDDA